MVGDKTKLFCIMGVDGAGKTTHTKILMNRLDNSQMKYKYVWFRFFHYTSYIILFYCKITGLTRYENIDGEKLGYHEFHKSKIISTLYPYFLFVDMVPAYFFKIFLPIKLGYILVCDRFIYDTLVDLMIDLEDFEIYNKYPVKLFLKLIPDNNLTIFLCLDEETIRNRREDLEHDTTLNKRILAYEKISKEFNIKKIKNDKKIETVSEKIFKYFMD